jgi:hypothetical protein
MSTAKSESYYIAQQDANNEDYTEHNLNWEWRICIDPKFQFCIFRMIKLEGQLFRKLAGCRSQRF